MPPEAAYIGTFLLFIVLGLWLYVQEQEIQEEHDLYDKDKVKYTDGDNT